jgi:hypothetical protein
MSHAAPPNLAVASGTNRYVAASGVILLRVAVRAGEPQIGWAAQDSMKLRAQHLFAAILFVATIGRADTDSRPVHAQTTAPSAARYEIVESTITVRDTYRLDRYTGRVWRIVKSKDDETLWEEMSVRELPQTGDTSSPRFQIFLSGIVAKISFLLDTKTGKTWQVVVAKVDPNGGNEEENTFAVWSPVRVTNLR